MLKAFSQFTKKEQLIDSPGTILLAVSGGIDSIVMCELFRQSSIPFAIAHCNFQLRAAESDEDEAFVEALAEKYKVAFHTVSFETKTFAKKNNLSIQMAARDLRYEWFEQVRKQFHYTAIATAHHGDDSLETFFINIMRGTGISGMHGILPKQGKVIRPMLFTDKENIKAFAKKHKLGFREDSSNTSDKYLRNNIRNTIIPALKKLNPAIEKSIAKDMENLRNAELIYKEAIGRKRKKLVQKTKEGFSISIEKLRKLQPAKTYLYEFLKPFNFNSASIDEIIHSPDNASGKQFFSDTHRLVKDRDLLLIQEKKETEEEGISIPMATKTTALNTGKLKFKTLANNKAFKLKTASNTASLDLDTLDFPLQIRKWQKGDTFRPIGMKGKKKLSDYFIDKKLSLIDKENVRVITSGDRIVWVIGHRIDDRFKITAKTKKIYFVELTE